MYQTDSNFITDITLIQNINRLASIKTTTNFSFKTLTTQTQKDIFYDLVWWEQNAWFWFQPTERGHLCHETLSKSVPLANLYEVLSHLEQDPQPLQRNFDFCESTYVATEVWGDIPSTIFSKNNGFYFFWCVSANVTFIKGNCNPE